MGLVDAEKNVFLDATTITQLSLHTADPGATGANEVTGGTPAYARKVANWSAAAAGDKTLSDEPIFDVPAGTVAYVGFWDVSNVWRGSQIVTSEVYAGQGTYKITAGTISLT